MATKADQQVIKEEAEAEKVYQAELAKKQTPPRAAVAPDDTSPASIGGRVLPICPACGKPIELNDSHEVLPFEPYARIHRPACKV